jgi:hypothetical protein
MISLRTIHTWSKQSLGIHSGNARFQRHSPLAKDWRLPKLQVVRRCIRHNKCPGAVRSPARCCPRGTPGYLVFIKGILQIPPLSCQLGVSLQVPQNHPFWGFLRYLPFRTPWRLRASGCVDMFHSSLENHQEIWGIPTCHPSGPVTEVHVEAFVAGHIAGLSGPNGTLAFAEVQLAELVIIHLGLVPKQPRTLNGSVWEH